jgi:serine/threonine protein kinase
LPNSPKELIDLLSKLLVYDAKQRITAQEAILHPYFADIEDPAKLEKLNSTMMSFASTIREKIKYNHSP